VRIDDVRGKAGALVVDPGTFSDTAAALDGATAILVTHEHPDHIDASAVARALGAISDLQVWCPASVANVLDGVHGRDRVNVVQPGQEFTAAGFGVQTYGGQHAQIEPSLPIVPNLAYVIEGNVLHPGDSFTVPPTAVRTLLLPLHAPWSKVAEVLAFLVAVRAAENFAIHDALLSEAGIAGTEAHVHRVAASYGLSYRNLASGESVTLPDED
jgi:L-ascorbate metabolism protein UlaG (beta-lactamase superfamily)